MCSNFKMSLQLFKTIIWPYCTELQRLYAGIIKFKLGIYNFEMQEKYLIKSSKLCIFILINFKFNYLKIPQITLGQIFCSTGRPVEFYWTSSRNFLLDVQQANFRGHGSSRKMASRKYSYQTSSRIFLRKNKVCLKRLKIA